jgi:hypothetical protein
MNRLIPVAIALPTAVALAACNSATTSAPPAAAPAATATHSAGKAKPKASPKPQCTAPTFDYIVRDDDPGASILADEIGNCDGTDGKFDVLSTFASTAGQASGECTTIALASDNPGYNVNAVPAAPLKDVIESAGPGCS